MADLNKRARDREYSRRSRRKIREKVIARYGGRCACCGEVRFGFLTIDHMLNNGAAERVAYQRKMGWKLKSGGRGVPPDALYREYLNGPRRADLQVLCYNCNCAKQYHGGCPHETERAQGGTSPASNTPPYTIVCKYSPPPSPGLPWAAVGALVATVPGHGRNTVQSL